MLNYFEFDLESIMTEAFYGKDKRFFKCEDALEMIRAEVREGGGYARRIDDGEGNTLLQKTLCDIFGFKKLLIHWDISVTMGASNYTLPTAAIIMGGKAILGKLPFNKIPYDSTHTMTCVMDCSQSLFKILTNAQIMGVIIHEIGHNFEVNPYKAIQFIIEFTNALMAASSRDVLNKFDLNQYPEVAAMIPKRPGVGQVIGQTAVNLALTTNPGKPIMFFLYTLWDRIMQFPLLAKISRLCGSIAMGINRWCNTYLSPLATLGIPLAVLVAPFAQIGTVATRKGEQFADNIVAAYGYGTEWSEAIDIMMKYYVAPGKDYYKKAGSFKKALYNLGVANLEIMTMLANDHGSAMSRTASMLAELKKSVNDTDLTPAQKMELNKEIKKLEDTYQAYGRLSDGEHSNVAVAVRSFIMKYFDGSLGLWDRILPDLRIKEYKESGSDEAIEFLEAYNMVTEGARPDMEVWDWDF